jgi:hypothetical protein
VAGVRRDKKPITTVQIAALLKPFEIPTNKTVRRAHDTAKGYKREDCEDAFARYLPPRSVTRSQPSNPAAFGEHGSVTPIPVVTDQESGKHKHSVGCDLVTAGAQVPVADVTDQRFVREPIDVPAGGEVIV